MALSCKNDVEVFSVDPYLAITDIETKIRDYSVRDKLVCQANLAISGALRKVRDIHLPSRNAVRAWSEGASALSAPGLIFIDGSHEYEDVRNDFACWFPHLARGGTICFHDSTNEAWGVFPLMIELKSRTDLEFIETVNSLTAFRKVR